MLHSGVYKIQNRVNGKCYIGRSKDIEFRWSNHLDQLRKGNHGNLGLQVDWDKYGEENFIFETIEEVVEESLIDREQFWLDKLSGQDLYNILEEADGSDFSDKVKLGLCNRPSHYRKHNQIHSAFKNVLTGEIILPMKDLAKTCKEHNLNYRDMHSLEKRRIYCSRDGWRVLDPSEFELYLMSLAYETTLKSQFGL